MNDFTAEPQRAQGKTRTVASIDIGTNTILLLIAGIGEGELKPLREIETLVRLGEGLQKNGVLSGSAMERGIQALAQYLDQCRAFGVGEVFAVGTSALREAGNSEEFLRKAQERLHLSIDVISGEEEARLSYRAVAMDLKEPDRPIQVIDVGGGSTEFIFGQGEQVLRWASLPMGSVRFTEQFLRSDPAREEEWDDMAGRIRTMLSDLPGDGEAPTCVAVGGTATTLASVEQQLDHFIPEKIHHFVLDRDALGRQLSLFKRKTVEKRKTVPGLQPARADVILAGGSILYVAMEHFKCPSVLISTHGLRYGLLYERLSLADC
jgi:exopolyphosphatase / guanosine-5'-triphosphate,3'-diphosphate pyrophosphatase